MTKAKFLKYFAILMFTSSFAFVPSSFADAKGVLFSDRKLANALPKILHIGDSQSEGFWGLEMYRYYIELTASEKVQVWGASASSPHHWTAKHGSKLQTWLCQKSIRSNSEIKDRLPHSACLPNKSVLENVIQSFDPDLVVFQFLGNSVGRSEQGISLDVSNLLENIGSKKCIFITSPPHFVTHTQNNLKRITTQEYFIRALGGRCLVIPGMSELNMKEFAPVREYYGKDEIHLSRKGAKYFKVYVESFFNN